MNKKGFTLIEMLVTTLIIAILAAIGWMEYSRFIERTRASEADNTIGLAVYAQSRQLMRKGRYTMYWTSLDAAPLATYMDKTGDYVNEEGTIFLTKGGGFEDPRPGYRMYFEEAGGKYFVIAERINWRYAYTLVRPFTSTKTYCVPTEGNSSDMDFCLDYMELESESELPEDPRETAREEEAAAAAAQQNSGNGGN